MTSVPQTASLTAANDRNKGGGIMSDCVRQDAAAIACREFKRLVTTAERAGIGPERLRRLARLSPEDWQQWLGILNDRPLPADPALPLMLRHLGYLNARLDRATTLRRDALQQARNGETLISV